MRYFLIAEREPILLRGLRIFLEQHFQECTIVAVKTLTELMEKAERTPGIYDVAIVNMTFTDGHLATRLKSLRRQLPYTKIVVLALTPEHVYAGWFLTHGASAYLNKGATEQEVFDALCSVMSGNIYLGPRVLDAFTRYKNGDGCRYFRLLGPMELHIIHLLIIGKFLVDIARMLGLSSSTVATHAARAIKKLRCRNIHEVRWLVGVPDEVIMD